MENKLPLQKQTLCWGDARPGNVLEKIFQQKPYLIGNGLIYDPLMDLYGFAIDDANSQALNVPKLEGTMMKKGRIGKIKQGYHPNFLLTIGY